MRARRFLRTASFTRPSNTTQYTAADAVSDNATTATIASFTLTGMAGMVEFGGVIRSVMLHKSDHDLTAAAFDINFYTSAPSGANFEDNAEIALTDAENQACIGFVELLAADGADMKTGDLWSKTNLDIHYECAAGLTSLYYVIIARDTYTPASAEVFTLRVGGEVW